jgi:hypothetical protein
MGKATSRGLIVLKVRIPLSPPLPSQPRCISDPPPDPPRDFAKAIAQWYPTWPSDLEDRAMILYVPTLISLLGHSNQCSRFLMRLPPCPSLSHPIGYTLLDIISYSDYVKMWKHC